MAYKEIATDARKKVLDLIFQAQTSHLGSNFSAIDILTVLFDKIDLDKDKFVLSKGWVAASLYYFLWKKGRITKEQLDSYCKEGSKFIGLAEPITKDILISGGSMGLGLPGAVGLALAKKLKGEGGRVYVLMSDGEMDCGTTWESALIAAHHHLDNLVVLIDCNGWQAMGMTENILMTTPLREKFESFGCDAMIRNGHDYREIEQAIFSGPISNEKVPLAIIFHTIKGEGVSFMRHDNIWHYKAPSEIEYKKAMEELCQK